MNASVVCRNSPLQDGFSTLYSTGARQSFPFLCRLFLHDLQKLLIGQIAFFRTHTAYLPTFALEVAFTLPDSFFEIVHVRSDGKFNFELALVKLMLISDFETRHSSRLMGRYIPPCQHTRFSTLLPMSLSPRHIRNLSVGDSAPRFDWRSELEETVDSRPARNCASLSRLALSHTRRFANRRCLRGFGAS